MNCRTPAFPPCVRNGRGGAALVLALGLLAVATAMALGYLSVTTASQRRAESLGSRFSMRAVAADAAFRALQRLADDEDLTCDDPSEPWARPLEWTTPEGLRVRAEIRDDSGSFDLNNLALERPEDAAVARMIVQDVLSGTFHPAPVRGAELLGDALDADHVGDGERVVDEADRSWPSGPNRALVCSGELNALRAMARVEREKTTDAALPWGLHPEKPRHPEPININFASEQTIRALIGPSRPAMVAGLIALREAAPLRSLDSIAAVAEPLRMNRMRPFLDVRSRWFSVAVRVENERQVLRLNIEAVRDAAGQVEIRRWFF